MKKIINRLSVIAISGTLLFAGCSKSFTTQTPSDSVPLDAALNTISDLTSALNGAYSDLRAVALYGRDFLVLGDLQADNTYVEVKNSGRYIPQYNYSVTVGDGVVGEMWSTAYNGILRANQIINSKVTASGASAIIAQAYAIRALLYFKLVNIYAKPYTDDPSALGVPIILTYNPYLLPTRNTIKEVYTQIVSDLQAAFTNAPDYVNSVHLSKYAIEGLLARVYLYMGDNADAETAAADVISNSGFTLVTPSTFNAFWANPAIQSNQVEVMFEVDADAINSNGYDDVAGIYINGYQDLYASSQLYNLYSATDVRKSILLPGTTKSGAPAYLVNKFPNALNADRDNLKVIRLAEVYLIAAEAALPGNEATALTYLNALVAQRDPGFVYASTGTQLLDDIVNERRKELAFEGDRFYDLNRLKWPINRVANPGAIPAGQGNVNLTIPYPDTRRVAPIPQAEIQANANIASQQNPGY
jgi:hypothetical protein